jgi:hypothetical protein
MPARRDVTASTECAIAGAPIRQRGQGELALEPLGDALAQLDGVAGRAPLPVEERERP